MTIITNLTSLQTDGRWKTGDQKRVAFKIVAVSLAARGAFMIVAASIEAKS